jgi:hypothetical protein
MDRWVEYSRQAIHGALTQLGYDGQLSFITFDTLAERVLVDGRDPNVGDLITRLSHVTCRGSTR